MTDDGVLSPVRLGWLQAVYQGEVTGEVAGDDGPQTVVFFHAGERLGNFNQCQLRELVKLKVIEMHGDAACITEAGAAVLCQCAQAETML